MTECNAENASNPIDARIQGRLASVSRMTALIVGAVTVVLANLVAESLPLGNTASALALFPVTLALLYVLLTVATVLETG